VRGGVAQKDPVRKLARYDQKHTSSHSRRRCSSRLVTSRKETKGPKGPSLSIEPRKHRANHLIKKLFFVARSAQLVCLSNAVRYHINHQLAISSTTPSPKMTSQWQQPSPPENDDENPLAAALTESSALLSRTSSIASVPEGGVVPPPTEKYEETAAEARAKALSNLVRTPVSSRPGSRSGSPTPSALSSTAANDDDVPTNVSTLEQLKGLPEECLSGDPIRPLQHFDEGGDVFKYALNPMTYSVLFVLIVEGG